MGVFMVTYLHISLDKFDEFNEFYSHFWKNSNVSVFDAFFFELREHLWAADFNPTEANSSRSMYSCVKSVYIEATESFGVNKGPH